MALILAGLVETLQVTQTTKLFLMMATGMIHNNVSALSLMRKLSTKRCNVQHVLKWTSILHYYNLEEKGYMLSHVP